MKAHETTLTFAVMLATLTACLVSEATCQRTLVWEDNFDGSKLDGSKWTELTLPSRAYNNELQRYTSGGKNAQVKNGVLHIEPRAENGEFTSARLVSAGKADFRYGFFEIRARLPTSEGLWPAIWMLPTKRKYGGWPRSGEIDIMEHVSCQMGSVFGSVHTEAYNHIKGTQKGGNVKLSTSQLAEFHRFQLRWTPDALHFGLDDKEFFVFRKEPGAGSATWPFDEDFHFILNVAVGGDWGGWCLGGRTPDIMSGGVRDMAVDYVRVYREDGEGGDTSGCTKEGLDPYAPGASPECCSGLKQCLGDWEGSGRLFFKCQTKCGGADDNTDDITKECTAEGKDPWASGEQIACCEGTEACLGMHGTSRRNPFFLCKGPGSCATAPAAPRCTVEGKDPWASGEQIACCEGTEACLGKHGASRKDPYFLCKADCGCASDGQDPWRSGKEQPCCTGFSKCLRKWDGPGGRTYFKCVSNC